jgi:hypothetical protein
MAYTYRKPKSVEHLFEILGETKTNWDLAIPGNINQSQRYFDLYSPIVLIYNNHNKLIGAAHNKLIGGPRVIDPTDRDITENFTKLQLSEIDTAIKQFELF